MKLKITKTDGTSSSHQVTHSIEVAFERWAGGGIGKNLREHEKTEHILYLAWLCLKKAGSVVPFDDDFMDSIDLVELDLDDPNG